MQKSLSDPHARRELLDRLDCLTPETTAIWGRMTAPQMVAHVGDWMLMAKGELKTAPMPRALRFAPLKQIAIYWLPIPKGIPTASELISRDPLDWAVETEAVRRLVQWFEEFDANTLWPDHPVFGKLTPRAWCVLGYRHMDHHFRQFGV